MIYHLVQRGTNVRVFTRYWKVVDSLDLSLYYFSIKTFVNSSWNQLLHVIQG